MGIRWKTLVMPSLVSIVVSILAGPCMADEEGAALQWESFKSVEFDFGENLLRVWSDYEGYAATTGADPAWTVPDERTPIDIQNRVETGIQSLNVSVPKATASAFMGWLLVSDQSGTATLSNSAAGTTAIADKYDPTIVAMSWATQSTSVELGEEVTQGTIDWSPGITLTASGGAYLSSHSTTSIHDPVVVWTQDADGVLRDPDTVFELTAEFDANTELNWNRVDKIEVGIDGEPQLVPVLNEGPFLDAGANGSGSLRIRMDSELLPANRRGTVAVDFQNGVVTSSIATGIFSQLAPVEIGVVEIGTLPRAGSAAFIDRLKLTTEEDGADDRFQLNLNVDATQSISDVAACSDGVHVSVGPAVDVVQTFTLNPMQRDDIAIPSSDAERQTGLCLGELSKNADLLFGTAHRPSPRATLAKDRTSSPIDRFLRVHPGTSGPQTLVFDQGNNDSPGQTRRWTARFDVRRSVAALVDAEPVDPVDIEPGEVPVGDVVLPAVLPQLVGEVGAPVNPAIAGTDLANRSEATPIRADFDAGSDANAQHASTFAIGLLNVAAYGSNAASAKIAASSRLDDVSLFDDNHGFVVQVTDKGNGSVARLTLDGKLLGEVDISDTHEFRPDDDPWRHFEVSLVQLADGIDATLNVVDRTGELVKTAARRTIPNTKLAEAGYRLAIGSDTSTRLAAHDFDNLMTTFQQTGDVAWDGLVDANDFHAMRDAIRGKEEDPRYDIDLNGLINLRDLELIEDMIPNKRPGDTNLDGRVTFGDFLVLSTFFGRRTGLWSRGDFDSDGLVRFADFLALARHYEHPVSDATVAVPEPSSRLMLLCFGACGAGLLRQRMRRQRVVCQRQQLARRGRFVLHVGDLSSDQSTEPRRNGNRTSQRNGANN